MTAVPFADLPDPKTQAGFYAGVPAKRILAFFIDLLIIFLLSLAVAVLTFGLAFFVFVLVFGVVGFLYRVLTLAGGSATWGMRLMAVELRRHDGERFTTADAALHTIVFYICFGIVPLQVISAITMFATSRGQTLTDMVFGVVALNRKARN